MFLRENEVGRRVGRWLGPGQTLLDLGAGTGYISRWLRDRTGVQPTLTDVVAYHNRDRSLPFLELVEPFRVPVPDASFDAVLMLFVLHHIDRHDDQERLLDEAIRITRSRIILLEDTPNTSLDLAFNKGWDWILNLRHRVPTPFTFRRTDEWVGVFKEHDLSIVHLETYRPRWPTLLTYPHSLFVLDR
jgi:ubiquinone/menaquinone biosynthesis C-methylase UbiE